MTALRETAMDQMEQREERGTMLPEHEPQLRDQVTRLVSVLRQLATSRHAPVRHTARYDHLLWLDELRPHLRDGPELLRLSRPVGAPEPPAPRSIRRWLLPPVPCPDDVSAPTLRDRGPLHGRQAYLVDAPAVRDAYDRWMATTWLPWANAERRRRPLQRVHEQLVEMHRAATDRPESVELVLAAGLLHAPGPDVGDGLRVHLVGRPVRIEPDPATGEIVCTAVGAIALEADELLGGLPIHDAEGSAGMGQRLAELADTPLAPGLVTFLHEWSLRALTTTCTVEPGWAPPDGPAVRLAVAPALVARRRGASAVREHHDALLRALRDEQVPVPLGFAQLVRPIEPAQRRAWLGRLGVHPGIDDPLFPLPPTAAEHRILTRLGADAGVVVEGAAGTGRTRAAANLLGALLADGQRVLVTGERARPLALLAEMLPPGVRELCAVPGAGAVPDVSSVIAALAAGRAEFDAERTEGRIGELADRRADAAQEQARRRARMRAAREFEALAHPEVAPGYGGTPARIARTLAASAERDGWLTGPVRGRPPLDEAELAELLTLLRAETPARAARRDQHLPDTLPSPDALAALLAAVGRGAAARAGADPEIVALLERLPVGSRPDIVGAETVGAVAALRGLPGLAAWAVEITDSLLGGSGRTHGWERAVAQLVDVEDALAQDRAAGTAHVQVRGEVHLASAGGVLQRLADHLADGTPLRRMFKAPEQRDAERLGSGVLVDGSPPRTREAALVAADHLRVLDTARNVDASFAPLRTGLPLDADRGYLVDAMVALRDAAGAVGRVRAAAGAMARLLGSLPPPVTPVPTQVVMLEEFGAAALAVGPVRDSVRAGREIDALVASLEVGAEPAPETLALLDAIRRLDVGAYAAALATLAPARRERDDQRRCDELLGRLRAAAPQLDLLAAPPEEWAQRLPRWRHAWARAQAATWLAERTAEHDDAGPDPTAPLDALTTDLAVERARHACLGRMDENQVQALAAHRDATARLAGGAGSHAERFRAAVAAAEAVVAPAVPAWIMPIQQVLGRTPPGPDRFDVVIVDDAELCDLTSAFLLRLAPRVIVLGDDRRAGPPPAAASSVLDRVDVELPDVPAHLRAAFGVGADLLSLLRSRFGPVERLRRDHRGRPGLLAWSAADRDRPPAPVRPPAAGSPVRATHVPDGRAEPGAGGAVNRAEARAVVDSVVAQAATGGDATFGVVTLLGRPQADLITEELRDRLAPAEWARRRVRVGVPADFQGDERDVVWLSLVAGPAPGPGPGDRRALTVATSRARELLWVFHSLTPGELDPADPRRSLIEHARPRPTPAGDRGDTSPFAARVRADLVALGHRVEPGVTLDGRVVDLVVTAPAGSVAVTCDGEARRGAPDARAAELESEQELRRAGWFVERVRESVYLVDRDAALAPVLAALRRLAVRAPAGPSPMLTAPLPTGSVATRRLPAAPAADPVTERVSRVVAVPTTVSVPVTTAVPVARAGVEVAPTEALAVSARGRPDTALVVAAPPVTARPDRATPVAGVPVAGVREVGVREVGVPVLGVPAAERTGPMPVSRWSPAPPPVRDGGDPDADVAIPPDGSVVVPPPRVSDDPGRDGSEQPVSRGRHALIEHPDVPVVDPGTVDPAVDTPAVEERSAAVPAPRNGAGPVVDRVPADDLPGQDVPATGDHEPAVAADHGDDAVPGAAVPGRVAEGESGGPPESPVPESPVPESPVPASPVPEPTVPESPVPESTVPGPVGEEPVVPDPEAFEAEAPPAELMPVDDDPPPVEELPAVAPAFGPTEVAVPVDGPAQVAEPGPEPETLPEPGPETPPELEMPPEPEALPDSEALPEPERLPGSEPLPEPAIRDLRSVPAPVVPPDGYPSMFDARLVVPATNPVPPEEVQVEDRRLLLHTATTQPLTSRWVARALAVEVPEARALLRSMTEEGLLRHIVRPSGTHWVLSGGSAGAPGAGTLAPADIRERERVLGTARQRPLTVAAVRNLLGVGADSAREILADLVAQGDLEERGQGRVVHYVPAGAA